jgi:hypothetical protein
MQLKTPKLPHQCIGETNPNLCGRHLLSCCTHQNDGHALLTDVVKTAGPTPPSSPRMNTGYFVIYAFTLKAIRTAVASPMPSYTGVPLLACLELVFDNTLCWTHLEPAMARAGKMTWIVLAMVTVMAMDFVR